MTRVAPLPGLPPSLAGLRERGVHQATVDEMLHERRIPLVDGRSCTFIYRGSAEHVAVDHRVVGLPNPLPMQPLHATDIWYVAIDLPPGARIEYRLLVTHDGHVETSSTR
ncbi:MAG: hypothetical protein ABR498_07285 [Candidatus Dormibacteria bacterium]